MIDRRTWLLLAQRLQQIREAREPRPLLVFDSYDQARLA